MSLLRKIYGSAFIAANVNGQSKIPFLPKQEIERIRDRRIQSIVRFAAKNVPFYKDFFSRERLDPQDFNTAADLIRLPLLDKQLVRSQPRLFLASTITRRNAIPFHSSGSTGVPREIHHDRQSLLANICFGERERAPIIRICGAGFRPNELYVSYENSTFTNVVSFYEKNVLFPVRPRRTFVSMSEPLEKIAERLQKESFDIVTGFGGWIHLFFNWIAAQRIEIRPPKLVLYMGEALPPGGRELIEEQFGVPVFSRYNTVECFKIGFYCEERRGFHLHEDLCHLRIDESGEIIISNLINRGTVLLNYPVGDLGSLSHEKCPCGRTFTLLSELKGRVEDIMPLKNGMLIHPRMVWKIFKNDPDLIQYQLIQYELERFELYLVTLDELAYDRLVSRCLPQLQLLLGSNARIEVERRTQLERNSGTKFRAVYSHCARNAEMF